MNTDTKEKRLKDVMNAYVDYKRGDEIIPIINREYLDSGAQTAIMDIQQGLNVAFELSYSIMSDACDIVGKKTIDSGDGADRDVLNGDDCDFFADADSQANIYTGVQLSYLKVENESEISELMQDESITSIAQACSIWYIQKVAEACELLRDYINQA